MPFCMNCGQELPNGAKFCSECGRPIGEVGAGTSYRKINYDGELHKCPNCNELLNSFVTNCPSCGYELRSVNTNSPVNELIRKVEKASSVDEKIELITNFYVPNTKGDIYDFFILAVSNLEDSNYDTDDAWQAKLEQTYHKAKISFGDSVEFDYIEKLYNGIHTKLSKRQISSFVRKHSAECITALFVGMGVLMLIIGIIMIVSFGSRDGDTAGGILILLSMCITIWAFVYASEAFEKKRSVVHMQNTIQRRGNNYTRSIGKAVDEFYLENCDDVVEQLRVLGFTNIVTKPEKKGLLDTEGTIKAISVAGNSDFRANDEFDVSSKVIIRYYTRKC